MDLKLSRMFIQVDGQDEALVFYRDVLGLEVRADQPFDGFRWLTVGPAGQPEIEIVLAAVEMGRAPEDVGASGRCSRKAR
jgi:catechol 2,3-dioxygenase-like lactoylglutathione lyase family enzyme